MKWLLSAAVALALLLPNLASAAPDAEKLWKAKCANCHGADGVGATKMGEKLKVKDMTTAEFQGGKEDEWKKAVMEGIKDKKKPAFKDKLSAEEVDALIKYVHTFKK